MAGLVPLEIDQLNRYGIVVCYLVFGMVFLRNRKGSMFSFAGFGGIDRKGLGGSGKSAKDQ